MHRKCLLLLALRLTQAFVPTLPRTTRLLCHSESSAVPAEPESEAAHAAPPVEAPPAAPPAETEDETLMTSLEAALVAEEASAAACADPRPVAAMASSAIDGSVTQARRPRRRPHNRRRRPRTWPRCSCPRRPKDYTVACSTGGNASRRPSRGCGNEESCWPRVLGSSKEELCEFIRPREIATSRIRSSS